jgi:hypothetical protein
MSNNAILSPADGFARSTAAIKLLLGIPSAAEEPISIYTKFRLYGYSVVVRICLAPGLSGGCRFRRLTRVARVRCGGC